MAATLTTLGIWACMMPCTWVMKKIKKSKNEQRDRTKDRKRQRDPNHSFDCLMNIKPWDLVWWAAVAAYIRLCLDCLSWTYYIMTGVFGWVGTIIDSASTLCSAISVTLMTLVFIHRCYITFVGSASQHSSCIYLCLFFGVASVFISGLVMAYAVFAWMWLVLAYAAACFVVSLMLTTMFSTYFFISPLYELARQSKQTKLTHVCARFLVLTFISMFSTTSVYAVAATAYFICDYCYLIYAYYNLISLDSILNLTALWFTIDSNAYYSTMERLHALTVTLFDTNKIYGDGVPHKKNGDVGENTATVMDTTVQSSSGHLTPVSPASPVSGPVTPVSDKVLSFSGSDRTVEKTQSG